MILMDHKRKVNDHKWLNDHKYDLKYEGNAFSVKNLNVESVSPFVFLESDQTEALLGIDEERSFDEVAILRELGEGLGSAHLR